MPNPQLEPAFFKMVFDQAEDIEVLLVGTGLEIRLLPPELKIAPA